LLLPLFHISSFPAEITSLKYTDVVRFHPFTVNNIM